MPFLWGFWPWDKRVACNNISKLQIKVGMTPIREFTKIYFQGDALLRGDSKANHFILGIKPRMRVIGSMSVFHGKIKCGERWTSETSLSLTSSEEIRMFREPA